MSTTLITILGKGRYDEKSGYKRATYQFADGTQYATPYFGLALAEHLKPKTLIILGTSGSMWDVLIEQHLADADHHEALRLELMESAGQNAVTQDLLDRITPLLQASIAHEVVLRLIPNGQSDKEQISILQVIAHTLGKRQNRIHIDITHGFRHLAIVGFLSAAMLERLRAQLSVEALWYGALDMTQASITPVIRLDGLSTVHHWISALDRFDTSGDYGVFAPLLEADGLPADKAHCLIDAAFYENTTQIPNAARSLHTVIPELEKPLNGASKLFQEQLKKRLQWAKDNNLAKQQHVLALRALNHGDYLRACILGFEALISHQVHAVNQDPHNFDHRKAAENLIKEGNHSQWFSQAYWDLKNLRNSMAHGTPPDIQHLEKLIKNRERLPKALESLLGQISTHLHD
jgi:CRISPR-associated Csx2 family protein